MTKLWTKYGDKIIETIVFIIIGLAIIGIFTVDTGGCGTMYCEHYW